jgi:hypothetical protein
MREMKLEEDSYVGNIIVIDVRDKGRIHMSKINIARWRLLEILFLDF